MLLALEAPTQLAEMVHAFQDFDWILAHKVLEDEDYANFCKNSSNIKFLDNSVNELGEPIALDRMKEVAEVVGANYIVAPDYFGDARRTIDSYHETVKALGEGKVVGVLQGQTFEEAFMCLNSYKGSVAVPYAICSDKQTDSPLLMALKRALIVSNIPSEIQIHLLGYNDLSEFFWYRARPNVVSLDTGIPILLGLQELDILDILASKSIPTLKQAEKIELSQKGWTAICRNIALLRKHMV